uniref:Secreted protein n=1 Tax=Picea sitchensis TaxID=3332 RepID=D5A7S6_PICSI|nr:unknown [Picea sitchensis]
MLGVLGLLSFSVLCLPSCRKIPSMLTQLSSLARTLYSFLQRAASNLRGAAYSDSTRSSYETYYGNANSIATPWNNLMAGFAASAH